MLQHTAWRRAHRECSVHFCWLSEWDVSPLTGRQVGWAWQCLGCVFTQSPLLDCWTTVLLQVTSAFPSIGPRSHPPKASETLTQGQDWCQGPTRLLSPAPYGIPGEKRCLKTENFEARRNESLMGDLQPLWLAVGERRALLSHSREIMSDARLTLILTQYLPFPRARILKSEKSSEPCCSQNVVSAHRGCVWTYVLHVSLCVHAFGFMHAYAYIWVCVFLN